jgi:ribosomal-protein-alanine N-acetyltransferase
MMPRIRGAKNLGGASHLNVIETERLNLREMSDADAPFMLELLNDPDFIRFIADRGVRTNEEAARYIEARFVASYRQHGFGLWLVETKDGREAAGMCGLLKRGEPVPGVEVGYAFLPKFRGRGYAYEAAAASARYAREVLGLPSLYAVVNPDNDASIRVIEKLGLTYERPVRLAGEESDISLFAAGL